MGLSKPYRWWVGFYDRWQALMNLLWGGFIALIATFLAVVAVIVFQQQEAEHAHHRLEAKTVHTTCIRSVVFGPPLIDFLERAEGRLHTGALDRELTVEGKKQSVIAFYRTTIPKSCP